MYKNLFALSQILGGLSIFQFITQQIEEINLSLAKDDRFTEKDKKEKIEFKYNLPDLSIFKDEDGNSWESKNLEKECEERGKKLEEKLHHFGIRGKVVAIKPGPVVTLFEFKPEIDSKISKIIALEDDAVKLVDRLNYVEYPSQILRQLQKYSVQIYPTELDGINGYLETTNLGIKILNNSNIYSDHFGLMLDVLKNSQAQDFIV